jgi:hypothetical protein
MVELKVSLQEKWVQYLKSLADEHVTDFNTMLNELFQWAFSSSEGKKQFEAWLDDAYPQKGDVEDKRMEINEESSQNEEESEEESEAEGHAHRD